MKLLETELDQYKLELEQKPERNPNTTKKDAAIQLSLKETEIQKIISEKEKKMEELLTTLKNKELQLVELREETKKAQDQTQNLTQELNKVKKDLKTTRNLRMSDLFKNEESYRTEGSLPNHSSRGEQNLRRRLKDNEEDMKQLENKYKNLKAILDSSDEEIKKLKKKVVEREDELFETKVRLEQNSYIFEQIKDQKQKIEIELQQKNEKENLEKKDLEEKNENLEKLVQELQKKNNNFEEEIKNFKMKIQSQKEIIKKIDLKENELKNLIKEKEKLITECQEMQSLLSHMKEQQDWKMSITESLFDQEIKLDKIRIGSFLIFRKLHSSVYVPLISQKLQIETEAADSISSEEDSIYQKIEEYLNSLENFSQEEHNFVPAVATFKPPLILSDSSIVVAKVSSIWKEELNFEKNKKLVSFFDTDFIWKLGVETPLYFWNNLNMSN